jgi:hypothetical protein
MTGGVSTKQSQWGKPMRHTLTELEAFDAMLAFIEAFWRRDGSNPDDGLAKLLSFTSRTPWPNGNQLPHLVGAPLDIAQWEDWLAAIEGVKSKVS